MLDAAGDALVAGRFGSLSRLELGGRITNCHDVAINCLAKAAWKNARRHAHVLCGGLRRGSAHQYQSRHHHSEHPRYQQSPHCSCSILASDLVLAFRYAVILGALRRMQHVFLTNGAAEMPNWIEPVTSA